VLGRLIDRCVSEARPRRPTLDDLSVRDGVSGEPHEGGAGTLREADVDGGVIQRGVGLTDAMTSSRASEAPRAGRGSFRPAGVGTGGHALDLETCLLVFRPAWVWSKRASWRERTRCRRRVARGRRPSGHGPLAPGPHLSYSPSSPATGRALRCTVESASAWSCRIAS